jgi:hypothetical protein
VIVDVDVIVDGDGDGDVVDFYRADWTQRPFTLTST